MKADRCRNILLIVMFLSVSIALADDYLWDQTNDYFSPQSAQGIQTFSPIGQEFMPSFDCLEVVQLEIVNIEGVAELFINIYSGSIAGPLVGSSNTIILDGFYFDTVTFSFDPITLVPQTQYVMIVILTEGDSCVSSSGVGYSTYPLGCQILSGIPMENNDLWFREGVLEGSTLSRLSWGSIKNLCW